MIDDGKAIDGKVYLIRNRVNGKGYVGITATTIDERWNGHINDAFKKRSMCLIHRAIRKYGIDAFERSVLETHVDSKSLKDADVRLIAELKTYFVEHPQSGYNMTKGGDGTLGLKWNDESKKRASKARIGWIPSDETRRAMRESHLGLQASEETRVKQSVVHTGVKDSDQTRAKKSEYSKNRSQQHLERLSASQKGKVIPEEQREMIRKKLTGRKLTEEHKRAIVNGLMKNGMKEILGRANRRENLLAKRLEVLSEISSKPVEMFDKNGNLLRTFSSINKAAHFVGVTGCAISHAESGLTKTSAGYVWRYSREGGNLP
jgi:group I intron endonuclease